MSPRRRGPSGPSGGGPPEGNPPEGRPPGGDAPAGGPAQPPPGAEAELIAFPGRAQRTGGPTEHLAANRGFLVRRALLASAVGGMVPLPVLDDYLAGRVRAGMLIQVAGRRHVDLAPSSAELLGDAREGTAVRNATLTAATMIALKLAWKKFFAVLAIGRRAEDMATTFQVGTLFDHFCHSLHVGAGVDRPTAFRLRAAMFTAIEGTERAALVGAFRDGGRLLGRSLLEAPAWMTDKLQRAVQQYAASGGNPDAIPPESPLDANQARWLDRAASTIEDALTRLGSGYLESLLARFDQAWRAGGVGGGPTGPARGGYPDPTGPAGGAPPAPGTGGPEPASGA